MVEIIGYIGSGLVMISMLMTSVKKLRIINTVGSVIFTVYAIIIKSYPTAIMNVFLVFINLYHLYKLMRTSKPYGLIECGDDDASIRYFLDYYKDEIKIFYPNFDMETKGRFVLATVCEEKTIGVLVANKTGEGNLHILLDYVSAGYRDLGPAKFVSKELKKLGYKSLSMDFDTSTDSVFIKKFGYVSDGSKLVKEL